VFPAWAGMNRWHGLRYPFPVRVPRVGGDEPRKSAFTVKETTCSPRGRG